MGRDRRRYPRVGVGLDITVDAAGGQWQAKTVDLSPHGVKIAMPATSSGLRPGTKVQLQLAVSDQKPALSLTASVVRSDPDGIALDFINPGALCFARLKEFVDSLLQGTSNGPACLGVSVSRLKDRRRSPRVDAELDINLAAEAPRYWQGKTINLSTIGVKVALPATASQPPWGTSVQLRLAGADGQPPISLKGLVWRREPDTTAFLFVELSREQLERLRAFVESLRA
jgi:hypothetical protein